MQSKTQGRSFSSSVISRFKPAHWTYEATVVLLLGESILRTTRSMYLCRIEYVKNTHTYIKIQIKCRSIILLLLTLTVLVATIDAQWEGMRDVGSARYEPALLPPWLTIRVLSYSN